MRALLDGKDVLAVLPTVYGKSLIYHFFVCAKDHQMNGKVMIKLFPHWLALQQADQIQDIIRDSAIDISELTLSEINQGYNIKVMFVGAEKVKEKTFRQILTDQSSLLHLCCCIAHVSMANRFSVLKVTRITQDWKSSLKSRPS